MINAMETLQNILNNNKGDTKLYKIIFNNLSDNNNIKNYTDNRNGIFFNMNNFDSEKIKNLCDNVNSYINNKKEFEKIEEDRESIMKDFSNMIDSSYKNELKEFIQSNKNKLSTYIDIEKNNTNKQTEEKMMIKKKINQRMKKSIDDYQKPMIYKGSYDRVKNVLSKSSRRYRNTSIIEESDKLYEEYEDDKEEIVKEEIIIEEGSIYNSENESEEYKGEDLDNVSISDSDNEIQDITLSKNQKDPEIEDNMKDLFGSDSE